MNEWENIANHIYEDAKEHFRKTEDLNYFSQYYPDDIIDFMNAHLSEIVGEEMKCRIDYPMPCLVQCILCTWPPPNHSRIICQRHDFIERNNVNKSLL